MYEGRSVNRGGREETPILGFTSLRRRRRASFSSSGFYVDSSVMGHGICCRYGYCFGKSRGTTFSLSLSMKSWIVQGKPPDWQDFVGIVVLLIVNSTISSIEENNAGNTAAALEAGLAPNTKENGKKRCMFGKTCNGQ